MVGNKPGGTGDALKLRIGEQAVTHPQGSPCLRTVPHRVPDIPQYLDFTGALGNPENHVPVHQFGDIESLTRLVKIRCERCNGFGMIRCESQRILRRRSLGAGKTSTRTTTIRRNWRRNVLPCSGPAELASSICNLPSVVGRNCGAEKDLLPLDNPHHREVRNIPFIGTALLPILAVCCELYSR